MPGPPPVAITLSRTPSRGRSAPPRSDAIRPKRRASSYHRADWSPERGTARGGSGAVDSASSALPRGSTRALPSTTMVERTTQARSRPSAFSYSSCRAPHAWSRRAERPDRGLPTDASAVSLPPPGGFMGKREPQIILKTDERSIHLELGRERKFTRRIKRWAESRRRQARGRSQERPPAADPASGGAATGRAAASLLLGRIVAPSQRPATPLRCAVTCCGRDRQRCW
jgi:hypothetical protein